MDGIYARQRHFYDATRKYFLLGRDHLIRELTPPLGGTVLEIGCGTGRNLIAAARAYPDAQLYGLDISTKMLATARANLRQTDMEDRIALGRGDATSFDPQALFGRSSFDRVFFSYSLSMIPGWRDALRRAHDAVSPVEGRLFVVDFGRQDGLPGWFRRLLHGWLTRFHVTPRPGLEDALAALRGGDESAFIFRRLYGGYASYAEVAR